MNAKTKKELMEFITAIEHLAHGVLLTVGMKTASDVVNQAERLKAALANDPTIE